MHSPVASSPAPLPPSPRQPSTSVASAAAAAAAATTAAAAAVTPVGFKQRQRRRTSAPKPLSIPAASVSLSVRPSSALETSLSHTSTKLVKPPARRGEVEQLPRTAAEIEVCLGPRACILKAASAADRQQRYDARQAAAAAMAAVEADAAAAAVAPDAAIAAPAPPPLHVLPPPPLPLPPFVAGAPFDFEAVVDPVNLPTAESGHDAGLYSEGAVGLPPPLDG